MDFEFDYNLEEAYELQTELDYESLEYLKDIRDAYEDMVLSQYDKLDALYW
jgi:hypothetical protein